MSVTSVANAIEIVPIYTGVTPMRWLDVSEADVTYAGHGDVWIEDMATGKATQLASGAWGEYTQITHDWIMWQSPGTLSLNSYRLAKLRDEGSVQSLPPIVTPTLDGDRVMYLDYTSNETRRARVDSIGGTNEAVLGYFVGSYDMAYPWVVWSEYDRTWARDLSSAEPAFVLLDYDVNRLATDGTTVVWMVPGFMNMPRLYCRKLPDGPVTAIRENSWSSSLDVQGDWVVWSTGALVYAYHIPTAQTIQVTPTAGFYESVCLSANWLVWLETTPENRAEGNVRGCRITDLLAELPIPVATRPTSVLLPESGISLRFQDLVTPGDSRAVVAPNRPAPVGYHLLDCPGYDITTSARTSGYTDITVPYDPALLGGADESAARLMLWKDAGWIDVTTAVDTAANTVTGRTYYLSQVAVARPRLPEETASVYRFYNKRSGTHFYTASAEERDSVIAHLSSVFDYEGVAYTYDHAKATQPLYRFFNKRNGSHFYTASWAEVEHVRATWPQIFDFEGPAYNISALPTPGSAVYRFYNNGNGSHFFTASAEERDHVIRTWPNVYTYEGEAFYLPQ